MPYPQRSHPSHRCLTSHATPCFALFHLLRYATTHPFGPFNSVATQLRPIQQALLLMLRRQPELVVEIVSSCSTLRCVCVCVCVCV